MNGVTFKTMMWLTLFRNRSSIKMRNHKTKKKGGKSEEMMTIMERNILI